ncbi:RCC1 domain-containing protein [Stigmatella erecta]|uniref:Alpha-tubulin suppressor n=1 Tax=Stigmatella erecta TaxID=83460 RepID=A0A1I0B1X1_9BACT|nr:hypothetical protein [Stigmatella erecta]SET00835.1 Alpha-tubulin suppressor [Stigmatella erecta]
MTTLANLLKRLLLGGWILASLPISARGEAPVRFVEVGLGYGHTCARLDTGHVLCWGRNNWGQLGRSDREKSLVPVEVVGLPLAERLVVGGNHNCILSRERQVLCWGYNHRGQLGRLASTVISSARPVQVQLTGVVDLALGGSHGCAVLEGGAVSCWGDNLYGQLGHHQDSEGSIPSRVSLLPPSRTVALGDQHSCALSSKGEVWCWGGNAYGQLGDGLKTNRENPAPVSGLSAVNQLSLGYSSTCALLRNGRVNCWGLNTDGQLGDGSRLTRLSPILIPLKQVAEVAVGSNHGCARLTNSRVACWGSQARGRLGDGVTSPLGRRFTPFVLPLRGITRVVAGGAHSCALDQSGALFCWGSNEHGMLGINSGAEVEGPTRIR